MSSNITATNAFSKKLKSCLKYNYQFKQIENTLKKAFEEILNITNNNQNITLSIATKYSEIEGLNNNTFRKYKLFDDDNLYIIYVICKVCNKGLRCSHSFIDEILACIYDIWIDS